MSSCILHKVVVWERKRSAESLKCIVESVSVRGLCLLSACWLCSSGAAMWKAVVSSFLVRVRRRFEAVHADATNGAQMVRVLGESYATSGATGAAALAIALNLVPL